jgi:hypothetical protein
MGIKSTEVFEKISGSTLWAPLVGIGSRGTPSLNACTFHNMKVNGGPTDEAPVNWQLRVSVGGSGEASEKPLPRERSIPTYRQ